MQDAVHFYESGAKWFRIMRGVIGFAVVMAALVLLFSVYRPPKPGSGDGSSGPALMAILVGAIFFVVVFGSFGLWQRWRKPLRLSMSKTVIALGENGPVIPWSVVDRVAFHWTGQRFETAPRALQVRYSMRSRLSLLVYVRDRILEQEGSRGLIGALQRYWYRTPFLVDLAMIDANTGEIVDAIQAHAPDTVLARSGLLDV